MTLAALIRVSLMRLLSGRRVTLLALQPWASRRALDSLLRLMAPDRLLVLTAAQAEQAWRLGIPAAVFPSGVDADRFRPATAAQRRELRRKWEITESARVLLHVGHLNSGRNLEALIPLTRVRDALVLVVCSSQRDDASERIRQALEAAGVHVLATYLPNIEELYRLADCYVFPTVSSGHAIGFPLSILEAMACDLPVATTRFGAIPDYLATAPGVRLVDDPAELSSAVEELLGADAEARPLAAEFTWDRAAAAILAG
jgi:glycosyltransferase involved in cell wall biosynthesis